MARAKKNTGIISVIVWVLIVLGAVSLIMHLVRGNQFSLQYEGKTLKDGTSNFEMLVGSEYDFDLVDLPAGSGESGYTVSIAPYCEDKKTDFYYTVSDSRKQYSKLTNDLTEYFKITQRADGFTVSVYYDIGTILGMAHGKTVEIADGSVNGKADYFKMTVTLADGSQSTNLYFRIGYTLYINPEYLEF